MPARASGAREGTWRSERDLREQLHALEDRAATIQTDLADLQRSMPYQVLFDGRPLTGLTHSRLETAMGAVEELWQGFTVLGEMMVEARATVGNGVAAELDDLRNVEWLLFDDSVELGHRRFTPDELLDELVHALSSTAQIFDDAEEVWRRTVPAMTRCEEEIQSLLGRAADLPSAHPVETLRQLQS